MNYPTRFTVGSNFDPYRGPVTNLPVDGQFPAPDRHQRQSGSGAGDRRRSHAGLRARCAVRRRAAHLSRLLEDRSGEPDRQPERRRNSSPTTRRCCSLATQAALASGTPFAQIDLGSGTANYAGDPLIQRSQNITAEDRALFAAYNASRPQSQWLAPVGILEITNTPYSNLASASIEGYDFNFTYNSPRFSWGRLLVSTDATYLHKYERQAGANAAVETRLGKSGATKWRGALNVSWSMDDVWSAGLSAYYIGEYADIGASMSAATYEQLGRPSYVYPIDGVYFWKVDDSITFNAFGAYVHARGRRLAQRSERACRCEESDERGCAAHRRQRRLRLLRLQQRRHGTRLDL